MAKRGSGKKSPSNEADYVVIGSGSSGAIVAGRLAQSGASVILLEAGPSDDKGFHGYFAKKPGMIGPMHSEPKLERLFDWGYRSVPQPGLDGRRMPAPRGKIGGGSSSVNGMVYVRGNRANYDSWAAEGNTGWDADSVNAAFKRYEDFEDGENEYRGAGGPIKITRNKTPQEATLQFIQATADTLGVKVLDDYNAAEQEGIGRMQQNAADGLRYSSTRGYVHHLNPPTLEFQTQVHATKIVIKDGRATGVEVVDTGRRGGTHRFIRAAKEVIVSAGFANTPQLLMLSGIGHADHLASVGIDCVADLPVGDNLHDHLFHPMSFHVPSVLFKGNPWTFAKGVARDVMKGDSFLNNSVFESVGFVRTSSATDVPNLQLHALPWTYPSPNQDEPVRHMPDPRPGLTVFSTLIYPKSRGTLRLASADPMAAPLIDYGFFTDPADVEVLAEGTEMIREIMASAAFGGGVKSEIHPGADIPNGPELRVALRNRSTSVYHGVGTCRMGIDERAVVTPDLKVRGIEGLRVADASIMPSITGGNTNAPCYMIGEKAAELILGGVNW
ncbi:GMC family oxidoreductase N-terminal domain-containing protein [Nocardioides sp. zg-536]|uniref:GMC family oxidoreductase N-terminal domain-containing protein n=1 Tax=Nocardioides faecalis TaxID=2803858 RepID=A0A939BY20_9ACTN|nr:GMC family oxidoreductase N-terminal domain-containing protein [Nocardioides faecalis]MBM9459460.1 GMC family oxidoreductase N-terminal domain-containing protein [Nocardioides faecalis]MBS4751701.1 GMC family oxidoreductase N-terminal domain-containing protein [Nocardioides faecalis]QVI59437.1 GMC family oxidoreductase N-terminal domain-containing protein [Nocardioides faecalis]